MANVDHTLSLSGDIYEFQKTNDKRIKPKNRDQNDSLLEILEQVNDNTPKSSTHNHRNFKRAATLPESGKKYHPSTEEYFPIQHVENKSEIKPVFFYAAQYGLSTPEHKSPSMAFKEQLASPISTRYPSSFQETLHLRLNGLPKIQSKPKSMPLDEPPRSYRAYQPPKSLGFDNHHLQNPSQRNINKLQLPSLQLPDERVQTPISARLKQSLKDNKPSSDPTLESDSDFYNLRSLKKVKSDVPSSQKSMDLREGYQVQRVKSEEYDTSSSTNVFNGPYRYKRNINTKIPDPLASFNPVSSSQLLKQIFTPTRDSGSSSERDLHSPNQERFKLEERDRRVLKFNDFEKIVNYRARLEQ